MVTLRDYQQRAIDDLYRWFQKGNEGNPCLVLPTGSGKSHIIAELCKDVIQNWPDQRILILTHVKELIEQDVEKILMGWPTAPLGIYSASIGSKRLGEPITVAGIQSIRKHAAKVGHIDIVIVDEAHLISHKDEGGYRIFLKDLQTINPALRVIGLTATPYRLGHGLITEGDALFNDLIDPTSIEELVSKGYLAPLRSKGTDLKLSTEGVHKRGGEFIESELQAAVNTRSQNERIVREVIARGADRKSWLFFCTGVDHALTMRMVLEEHGINAACVLGETPKIEREKILKRFKAGELRAVTNANVLTVGFDYPDIDLIAMCRPTMSPGLYVQMAGRGMRPKSHCKDCLVLDFAGVIQTHGPIVNVNPPSKKGGNGTGEAPVKLCEQCQELVPLATRICPECGWEFPVPAPPKLKLHDDDIMGQDNRMEVRGWSWRRYTSASGKEMVTVTYYGRELGKSVTEYLCLLHGGYAAEKAVRTLMGMARNSGAGIDNPYDLDEVVEVMNQVPAPVAISKLKDGKFDRVTARFWNDSKAS